VNFYNEIDPYAAQWLRNLIAAGHIAPGVVDERSIEDIRPDELAGYTQCHFFAGIGVWSRALRLAGWPDDRPVWTGSCPCQPFSAAGKGVGFDDERHLWPAFHWLISQCRPPVVFGEQVASKDGLAWLDLVQTDLEGSGYASAASDLCAAGVGAPHIRQRLYWVADSERRGRESGAIASAWTKAEFTAEINLANGLADAKCGAAERHGLSLGATASGSKSEVWTRPQRVRDDAGDGIDVGGVDNNNNKRLEGLGCGHQAEIGRIATLGSVASPGELDGLGDAIGGGRQPQSSVLRKHENRVGEKGRQQVACVQAGGDVLDGPRRPGPTNGHWRDADWLYCRDGKWRPVEPGTFPLAHGVANRVGRLRAYGNAIVPQVAQAFIEAYLK